MHNNRRRNHDRFEPRHDRGDRHERHDEIDQPIKKYSKGLILLKSSVIALFIVFATLATAFFIIKNNRKGEKSVVVNDCSKTKTIKISAEIDDIEERDGVIIVLTKAGKSDRQELIRVNAACGNELSRMVFQVSE